VIIDLSTKKKIESYVYEKVQAFPFSKEKVIAALTLTSQYKINKPNTSLNIDETIDIINSLDNSLITSRNLDRAAYALISITNGKLLNMVQDTVIFHNKTATADKKISFEKLAQKLFTSKYKSARRHSIMNVAKINDVEKFSFLGIEKLVEISRVISNTKSKTPIEDLLTQCGYSFNINAEERTEDFIYKINTSINFKKFTNNSLSPSVELVQQYTSKHGIAPEKEIKEIAQKVSQGKTLPEAMLENKKIISKTKTRNESQAPSFNDFESTADKLINIIEDILYYEIKPNYDSSYTKTMLYTLFSMQSDLIEFWKKEWKGFDE
jgi:hypothetical protein